MGVILSPSTCVSAQGEKASRLEVVVIKISALNLIKKISKATTGVRRRPKSRMVGPSMRCGDGKCRL